MTKFPAMLVLLLCAAVFAPAVFAQDEEEGLVFKVLSEVLPGTVEGKVHYDFKTGTMIGTNGVFISYHKGAVVLTADSASANPTTGDVEADGNVRIESANQLWVGEHVYYNFKTHQMRTEQFRTGRVPAFAGGPGLSGNTSNRVFIAHNAYVTTDDYAEPEYEIRAKTIRVIPGQKVQMWHAVFYADGVPVFYFPYYERSLRPHANHYTPSPGYRTRYGPYLLNTYDWYLGDKADGKIHLDYREKRGVGVGPDVDLHLGNWGQATLKYYYQHDNDPNYSTNTFPYFGNIPEDRQRVYFGWQATPATNLNLKALVNYQTDPLFLHDFFESAYTANPEPNTFIEAQKYWDNWSLDALTTPRLNNFFSQVERLPDIQLTGYRQQVLNTPVYYDSVSSAGWYKAYTANMTNYLYPGTNGYFAAQAARADTFHQFTLPMTFLNWLNVTPRVGGRLTYYSAQYITNGLPNSDVYRGVFNTGVAMSLKASRLWADATNSLLDVNGLRHIIEPSANYVFVPDPSTPPAQLPPFDAQLPSLMLLPVLFPDYNSIDSIDTMNVIRFGLRNILQTKRAGGLEDLVNWNLMMDWRLDPKPGQTTLNDLYSALVIRPRTWLAFDSQVRCNLDTGDLNLAFHQLTFIPNNRWSWGISHWYLRDNFISPQGNNYVASTFFLHLNDNWGLRMTHGYNLQTQRFQEQTYTVYRDLRSWTTAVSFRVQNNVGSKADVTLAFSLSLKANPSMRLGDDAVRPDRMLGD